MGRNNEEKEEKVSEESLTPPLLPNMKMVEQNDKKADKAKRSDWDMFAEQDIFKADTNVSFLSFEIHVKCFRCTYIFAFSFVLVVRNVYFYFSWYQKLNWKFS